MLNCEFSLHLGGVAAAIAAHCRQLRSLRCDGLYGDRLKAIVTNCTNLTQLDIADISYADAPTVQAIVQHCTNLTYLNISKCNWLSTADIVAIVSRCNNLQRFVASGGFEITDFVVSELAKSSGRNLADIDLCDCHNITDVSLHAIAKYCGASVISLNVFGLADVTFPGIYTIVRQCPNLRSLVVSCEVTAADVVPIAKYSKHLEKLSLFNGGVKSRANDASLAALALGCPRLRELNITSCGGITVSGISYLLQHARRLRMLRLVNLPPMARAQRSTLVDQCREGVELNLDCAK